MTVKDTAGNDAEVTLTFPAVAKGDQTLTNFGYSPASVLYGDATPTFNAPDGAENPLSYTAEPATVCEVGSSSGALTLIAVGTCEITATAAASDDYNEGTATTTVTVLPKGTLALNLDTIAGDDTVNIAEKAAGFSITGDTGTEEDASVTVTVGTEELTASSTAMGTWSVAVPANATYITGTSVTVTVSASKTGFTAASDVTRTLVVDLTAPTAPSYTTPTSLKVGEAMTDISPSGGSGIDEYAAAGLPLGARHRRDDRHHQWHAGDGGHEHRERHGDRQGHRRQRRRGDAHLPRRRKGRPDPDGLRLHPCHGDLRRPRPNPGRPRRGGERPVVHGRAPEGMLGRLVERGVDPHRGGNVRDHRDGRGERRLPRGHRHHHGHRAAQGDACPQPRHHRRGRHRQHRGEGGGVRHHRRYRHRGGGRRSRVTIGTQTTLTASSTAMGTWSVAVPANAAYITGTSVTVTVSASKTGFTAPSGVTRTLAVDLTAPTAPSYTTPTSLKVGEAIADISPSGGSGIDEYAADGAPARGSKSTRRPASSVARRTRRPRAPRASR